MNDTMFDVWARRAVRNTDRRAVLGLLISLVLVHFPSLTIAGDKKEYGSGGGKKDGKGNGGKKGGNGNGGNKKKNKKRDDPGMSREECELNYGACVDYWAAYCNGYATSVLRTNCQLSFISCCADLLTCTKHANARNVECVTLMDQIW
jgi:hypothetical protein